MHINYIYKCSLFTIQKIKPKHFYSYKAFIIFLMLYFIQLSGLIFSYKSVFLKLLYFVNIFNFFS